jgi:hypothetical protein
MFADSIENPSDEFLHIFGLCFGQRHDSRGDTQLGQCVDPEQAKLQKIQIS